MEQQELGPIDKSTKFDNFSKEDLIKENQVLESELTYAIKKIYRLQNKDLNDVQLGLLLHQHMTELREQIYGASSERLKKSNPNEKKKKTPPAEPKKRKPSERYPNAPVREVVLTMDPVPSCSACEKQLQDSGMTDDSEQITVIPKKFEILRTKKAIYTCTCHGCMKTTPAPERIIPGSSYSDEMIIDVALSKYCDLIPIERYVQMAARSGMMDLPPNSLIDLTHQFAFFVSEIYRKLKVEILKSRVLSADETPHRMLEGSSTRHWYLWGFSTPTACYLECHSTRSGDVASEILQNSLCEVLVSDVYSGYNKAIRVTNVDRGKRALPQIKAAFCNAHARRNFFKLRVNYPEAMFYLDEYDKIYTLNSETKGRPIEEVAAIRQKMEPHFAAMKEQAMGELANYPKGNKYAAALEYLLNNFAGLTLYLTEPEVPIDNNAQERLLRSHVVGRKTWYGTHSEQGAETAAILFSIVETCKLNDVNPREYFQALVQAILNREPALTPNQWKTRGLQ